MRRREKKGNEDIREKIEERERKKRKDRKR